MTIKQKDLYDFLGIEEIDIDPEKERLIICLEESDSEEEFVVQIFDVSMDESKLSLIKEIGYGILSNLYDEEFVESIRKSGKYDFNAKHPQPFSEKDHGKNIIQFKKIH